MVSSSLSSKLLLILQDPSCSAPAWGSEPPLGNPPVPRGSLSPPPYPSRARRVSAQPSLGELGSGLGQGGGLLDVGTATWRGWIQAGSQMSGKECSVTPSLPLPGCQLPARLPPPPPVLLLKLRQGGVNRWACGGREGSGRSPSQFLALASTAAASSAAKDSRGTWQARAATRWFGTWATGWAGGQASEAAWARPRGRLNGARTPILVHPKEVARVQAAARAGGGGSRVTPRPLPCPPPRASLLTIT